MDQANQDPRLIKLDDQFRTAMKVWRDGDAELAEHVLEQILTAYRELEHVERQATVHINLAQVKKQLGRFDEALAHYEEALSLADSIDDRRRRALILGDLSIISLERGDRQGAERYVEQSLELYRTLDDPVGLANQYGNLGRLHQGQGRLEQALDCYSRASVLFDQAGYVKGAIGVLQNVGELHRRQGDLEAALAAHRKALELAEQAKERLFQAYSLRAIGQLERTRGNLALAEELINRGMKLHRESGDRRGVLAALIDLGTLAYSMGRLDEALGHLRPCIDEARSRGWIDPLAKALLNRALYRLDSRETAQVKADLDEAAAILDALNDPALTSICSVTRARLLMREGRYDEMEALLLVELERTRTANLARMRPAILGLLGSLDTVKGNIKHGIERFQEAEVLYRALGDVEGARMSLIGLAQSIAESGAIEEGLKAMDAIWMLMGQSDCTQPALEGELLLSRAVIHHLSSAYEQALRDVTEARNRFLHAGFELSQLGSRIYEAKILMDAHRDGAGAFPPDLPERMAGFVGEAERFDSPSVSIIAHVTLADALALAARCEEARVEAGWALRRSRELPYPPGVVRSLEVLARLDHDREMAIQARNLWMSMGCTVWAARLEREWGLESAVDDPDECDPT